MTKIVNLDELAAAPRILTFRQTDYEVIDLDVNSFIQFQADLNKLIELQATPDAAATAAAAKKILAMCVPTFPHVDELNMRQLMAAVTLVADFFPEDGEEAGNA